MQKFRNILARPRLTDVVMTNAEADVCRLALIIAKTNLMQMVAVAKALGDTATVAVFEVQAGDFGKLADQIAKENK